MDILEDLDIGSVEGSLGDLSLGDDPLDRYFADGDDLFQQGDRAEMGGDEAAVADVAQEAHQFYFGDYQDTDIMAGDPVDHSASFLQHHECYYEYDQEYDQGYAEEEAYPEETYAEEEAYPEETYAEEDPYPEETYAEEDPYPEEERYAEEQEHTVYPSWEEQPVQDVEEEADLDPPARADPVEEAFEQTAEDPFWDAMGEIEYVDPFYSEYQDLVGLQDVQLDVAPSGLFAFGFGGVCVRSSGSRLQVARCHTLFADCISREVETPITSATTKEIVRQRVQKRSQDAASAGEAVIWRLLDVYISSDGAPFLEPSNLPMRHKAQYVLADGAEPSTVVERTVQSPSDVTAFEQMLVQGDATKALQFGLSRQLHAHALLLAHTLGPACFQTTAQQVAESLLPSDSPLRALSLARLPGAAFAPTHEWRRSLAALLTVPEPQPALTRFAAVCSQPEAVQCCALLLGDEPRAVRLDVVSADTVCLSQALEWARRQRDRHYVMGEAQVPRLQYALQLADDGHVDAAYDLVRLVAQSIDQFDSGTFSPTFVHATKTAESMLALVVSDEARAQQVGLYSTTVFESLLTKMSDFFIGNEDEAPQNTVPVARKASPAPIQPASARQIPTQQPPRQPTQPTPAGPAPVAPPTQGASMQEPPVQEPPVQEPPMHESHADASPTLTSMLTGLFSKKVPQAILPDDASIHWDEAQRKWVIDGAAAQMDPEEPVRSLPPVRPLPPPRRPQPHTNPPRRHVASRYALAHSH